MSFKILSNILKNVVFPFVDLRCACSQLFYFSILFYQSGPAKPRAGDQKRIFSRNLIQIYWLMEI